MQDAPSSEPVLCGVVTTSFTRDLLRLEIANRRRGPDRDAESVRENLRPQPIGR